MPRAGCWSDRRRAATFWSFISLLGGSAGCSDDPSRKGQLVVSMQTDMKVPEDVDRLRLEITSFGEVLLLNEYPVGPDGGVYIPATLGILEGDEPSAPVTIQLSARQRGKIRMLREATTTVPPRRAAMLRLPIQWLCDASGFETAPGEIDSTCPDGETCIAGACEPMEIDSETLPDFVPTSVFGGGTGDGSGACFDTIPCFASGTAMEVNFTDCSVGVPDATDDADFDPSAAIILPLGGDGICGSEACLIPLDADPDFGFLQDGDRLLLPPAVCERIEVGKAAGVAVTRACEQKTIEVPTCGPWSSVFNPEGTFAGPAPDNVNVGALSAPCEDPTDGSRSALCVTFNPSAVTPVDEDPELDGRGRLVVAVYAENALPLDPAAMSPVPLAVRTFPEDDGAEIGIDELTQVRFDGLPPGPVSVFAAFWDNADETSLATLNRGGGFVAGLDLSDGLTGSLQTWQLVAGSGRNLALQMPAIRRLRVTTSLGAGAPLLDDGNGFLSWVAYTTAAPDAAAAAVGRGARTCADLGSGSDTSADGFVIGSGPHYIVATLDEFDSATSDSLPWTVAGSLVSGAPGTGGTWTIPDEDRLAFPLSSYSRSFGVQLSGGVNTGSPPPEPFHCVIGACTDEELSPSETDVDCGGPCNPCADGLRCAGPADCRSRVCDDGFLCAAASCEDAVQNGTESDEDCGGDCGPCAEGLGCRENADCGSGQCIVSVCAPAASN